jgi:transmembrane sensor
MDNTNLLYKYFSGNITFEEKKTLFGILNKDEALRNEFAKTQNAVALQSLVKMKGDDALAESKLAELKKGIKKKKIERIVLNSLKYAAIIALMVITWVVSKDHFKGSLGDAYTWIEAPKGQRVSITLSDGTIVALNPSSKLKVPNVFESDERTVELLGEGFFKVAHNEKAPFTVKTENYNVQVLGTEFNVFAYPNSGIFETDLVKGRVYVYERDHIDAGIRLAQNEKARVVAGKLTKVRSDFAQKHLLDKGIYEFSGISLGILLKRLELWYGVTIQVDDPKICEQKYTGKLRQSDDVSVILKAISAVGKFNYRKVSDNKIEIY